MLAPDHRRVSDAHRGTNHGPKILGILNPIQRQRQKSWVFEERLERQQAQLGSPSHDALVLTSLGPALELGAGRTNHLADALVGGEAGQGVQGGTFLFFQGHALQRLMDKYAAHLSPEHDYRPSSHEERLITSVYRIDIEEWSGKNKVAPEDFPGAFTYPPTA